MIKIKYKISELQYPEPEYSYKDLVWFRKGNEKDGYWYKMQSPIFEQETIGSSVDEAFDFMIGRVPKYKIFNIFIY